jgi:GlpG protein
MRQIGVLTNQDDAQRFSAYLVAAGVAAHTEAVGDQWAIWVRDENHLITARDALAEFRADPAAQRYQGVEQRADQLRRDEHRQREQARKNIVTMKGRWRGVAVARHCPLVITMVVLCIGVYLGSSQGRNHYGTVMRTLLFADPLHEADAAWDPRTLEGRLIDIRAGQLWRLVTPIFIHFDAMHIAFNLILFYQLGGVVEDRRGTWKLGLLVLSTAAISNAVECLVGGGLLVGGMSGVLYGIFGYMWMKSRFQPELGIHISPGTVTVLLGWMLLCMTTVLERFGLHVANWAHGSGFLVGILVGYAPVLVKRIQGEL